VLRVGFWVVTLAALEIWQQSAAEVVSFGQGRPSHLALETVPVSCVSFCRPFSQNAGA